MLTEQFIDEAIGRMDSLILRLENDVIIDIARRISKTIQQGEAAITETAAYQLNRLAELRGFNAFYKSRVAQLTKLSLKEIDKLIIEAAKHSHAWDLSRFLESKLPDIPELGSERLHQITDAIRKRTRGSFENLTRTMGFKGMESSKYFRKCLTRAEMQVASGNFDYNTVTRRTVREMTENGLQSLRDINGRLMVQYPRKNLNVVSAVRMNILTAVHQVANNVAIMNGEDLGLKLVELSAHQGARTTGEGFENHEKLQGKRYSLSSYEDLKKAVDYDV